MYEWNVVGTDTSEGRFWIGVILYRRGAEPYEVKPLRLCASAVKTHYVSYLCRREYNKQKNLLCL